MQGNTIALWLFPLVVLAGGGIAILVFVRGQRRTMMAGDDTGEGDEARARTLSDEEGLS